MTEKPSPLHSYYVSADLRIIEVDPIARYAIDLTQQDEDGLRVYRRLTGIWAAWLIRHHGSCPSIETLIESHGGPLALAWARDGRIPPDYPIPAIPRPGLRA
jgi:hypothetical protein